MQKENQVVTSINIREEAYPLGEYRCLAAIAKTLHVHRTTLFRWRQHGHRGVRLHALKTPKGWMTTLQAVQHFLERLTSLEHPEEPILTPAREDCRQVRVEAELARRFGVGPKAPKGKEAGND